MRRWNSPSQSLLGGRKCSQNSLCSCAFPCLCCCWCQELRSQRSTSKHFEFPCCLFIIHLASNGTSSNFEGISPATCWIGVMLDQQFPRAHSCVSAVWVYLPAYTVSQTRMDHCSGSFENSLTQSANKWNCYKPLCPPAIWTAKLILSYFNSGLLCAGCGLWRTTSVLGISKNINILYINCIRV